MLTCTNVENNSLNILEEVDTRPFYPKVTLTKNLTDQRTADRRTEHILMSPNVVTVARERQVGRTVRTIIVQTGHCANWPFTIFTVTSHALHVTLDTNKEDRDVIVTVILTDHGASHELNISFTGGRCFMSTCCHESSELHLCMYRIHRIKSLRLDRSNARLPTSKYFTRQIVLQIRATVYCRYMHYLDI